MRLLLSVLGVFTVVACIENPQKRNKTTPGASINPTHPRSAGTHHLNNACPTGLGKAGLVLRTRRHWNHVHQTNPRGAKRLRLPQKAPAACRY